MNALTNLATGAGQLVKMGALPWFGGIAAAAFLAGASVGAVGGLKWNEGRALKAELNLSKFEVALAAKNEAQREREERVMRDAKELHDEQKKANGLVADELRRLATGVRICSALSTFQLAPAAAGPAQAPASGQPRAAETVLQELAAEFARRADDNAADYNSLMSRWEELSRKED